jgi:hypothetical protein
MPQALRKLSLLPLWWTVGRCVAIGIALVVLLGALISPWGLAKSHGAAAIAVLDHGEAWGNGDRHGHSHDDEGPAPDGSHAHHAGDHSHDHGHALPMERLGLSKATAVWQDRPVQPGPWPSPDGLERPPRT